MLAIDEARDLDECLWRLGLGTVVQGLVFYTLAWMVARHLAAHPESGA